MKGRSARATGGVNAAEEDLGKKNMRYTAQSNVNSEAEERKGGGRVKRRHGGEVHGSKCKCEKCMGGMAGDKSAARSDRKPRKSGGSATASPFSSAKSGTAPAGHKVEMN